MPWEVVIQVFDAAYLNWDPEMFQTTVAVHSYVTLALDGCCPAVDQEIFPLQGLAKHNRRRCFFRRARCVSALSDTALSDVL